MLPLELAILNEASRFNLVSDVIDRVEKIRVEAAPLKQAMQDTIADNLRYAHEQGRAPAVRAAASGCARRTVALARMRAGVGRELDCGMHPGFCLGTQRCRALADRSQLRFQSKPMLCPKPGDCF
jgi:hypothetical protein